MDDAWKVVEALVLSKPRWTDTRYGGYGQYQPLIRRAMFEGRESVVRALANSNVAWHGEGWYGGGHTTPIDPHKVASEILNNPDWQKASQDTANSVARCMLYVILQEILTKQEMGDLFNQEPLPTTAQLVARIPDEKRPGYDIIFKALIQGGATELKPALQIGTMSKGDGLTMQVT